MHLRCLTIESHGSWVRICLSGEPLSEREASELEFVASELAEREVADVRAVVLDSAGADFCVGLASGFDPLGSGLDPPAAIARLPMPVVASCAGRVASVGLEVALAADLRIAAATASFSLADVHDGRLPCWGGTQRLPRAAGRSAAARLVLAGETLTSDEARACGLVHQVSEHLAATVTATAERLAALAPLALALAKEALTRGPELPMRHALELEGDLNHLLQTTGDRAEGLEAFFAKREPKFFGE